MSAAGRVGAMLARARKHVDVWLLVELAGAGLLGGGVWAKWGAPWACMLWGLLLLGLAALQAALTARIDRASSKED